MEISLADERAFVLIEQLTMDQAEGRAWSHKMDAFGALVKFTKFLQRPKDNEFELVYKEHRYQPFWHVVCSAKYQYERSKDYTLKTSGPEVQAVHFEGKELPVSGGEITLPGVEHCLETPRKEVFVEGFSGEEQPVLAEYIQHPANEIQAEHLDDFKPAGTVVVPPQARASAILRDTLIGVIKSVRADRILEDHVEVERVDLYYRPVFAFQYRWIPKEKEAVIEYDAVTGKMEAGGKTFQQYVGKILDPEFLFDVGVDTVDLFVPGGGLAVKLAKKGIDAARSRGK